MNFRPVPIPPVIGGLASIAAKEGQEGVIIKGVIEPIAANKRLVIELNHFQLIVGDKKYSPATADVRAYGQKSVESVQWPDGHSGKMNKDDFPASISIIFLVTKNSKKVLMIEGGKPMTLSGKQ